MSEWIITSEELKNCLHQVTLVDVREPEELLESSIEGYVHIPLGELSCRAETELKKDADIVLYCAHGIRSLHGVMALHSLGYEKIRSLHGGIVAWEKLYGSSQSSG